MLHARRLIVLVSLAVLTAPAQASQPPSARLPASQEPKIEWTALPPDLPQSLRDSVRFGYFEVPEDHDVPAGPRIRIAIALLPALAPDPAPDPLVFIFGGPGHAQIRTNIEPLATLPPYRLYRERRDIIIVDPRGHGYSGPARCDDRLASDWYGVNPAVEQRFQKRLTECRQQLLTKSVRLETLTAVQAARDLEWLRKALGTPALNLYGASYGARIAAEAMRHVPATIRAVHFSAPVPHGAAENDGASDEALGALFSLCAAQAECRTAYPRLEADYEYVLAAIRREPVRADVPATVVAEGEILMNEEFLRRALSQFLVNRDRAARLPSIIHSLAQDGFGELSRVLSQVVGSGEGRAANDVGTFYAFRCNDGVIGPASSEQEQQRCQIWLGDAYTGREAGPVRSDLPALITTGGIDPRTPASFAHRLAKGLSRSHVVIVPGYGHERPPDCIFAISRAFLDAPERAPDTSCVASIAPLRFFTGSAPRR
jgi:pimeloyl-ACP methyl ester carboxylesterase